MPKQKKNQLTHHQIWIERDPKHWHYKCNAIPITIFFRSAIRHGLLTQIMYGIAYLPCNYCNLTTFCWTNQWINQNLRCFWILWFIIFGCWCLAHLSSSTWLLLFIIVRIWWLIALVTCSGCISIILLTLVPGCISIPWICYVWLAAARWSGRCLLPLFTPCCIRIPAEYLEIIYRRNQWWVEFLIYMAHLHRYEAHRQAHVYIYIFSLAINMRIRTKNIGPIIIMEIIIIILNNIYIFYVLHTDKGTSIYKVGKHFIRNNILSYITIYMYIKYTHNNNNYNYDDRDERKT